MILESKERPIAPYIVTGLFLFPFLRAGRLDQCWNFGVVDKF